jgi:zinc protease
MQRPTAPATRFALGLACALLAVGAPSYAKAPVPAKKGSKARAAAKAKAPRAPRPAPAKAAESEIRVRLPDVPFEKYTLENGLEIILHQDRSLPLVALNTWYHVGPTNEPKGRSGFAHLFEHLMFEGSRHVGHEFDRLLESAGATNVNGTTSWDRTNYFETVPRQQLELALWIESDRMGYMLDTLTQERLDVQRGVVQNERRQSYENAPYGPSTLALLDGLFPEGHPYHGAVIGSMADLSAATLGDVQSFFKSFYAPSNATLTIAGDFESKELKPLIEHYFGSLKGQPKPERVLHATPPLTEPKRLVVDEPVKLARVAFGFITPPAFGPDDAPLEVASAVLAGGKATRLYQALVVEKKVATDVEASLESNELASTFSVSATAATGHTAEEVERELGLVLEGLAQKEPSGAELGRAKRRILVELSSNLQLLNGHGGESGRAGLLQRLNHYLKDPGKLPEVTARLERVTSEDVKRVVGRYLTDHARLVVVTRPSGEGAKP